MIKVRNLCLLPLLSLLFAFQAHSMGMPNTPDGVVQSVVNGLKKDQPTVAWNMLPASYQTDVHSIIHSFAGKMDKELYNKIFSLSNGVIAVLKNKKSFILNSPMFAQPKAQAKKAELTKNWDSIVNVLNTVATSDISSLDKLQKFNVGDFLDSTGSQLMQQSTALSQLASPKKQAKDVKKVTSVKLASRKDNNATVLITYEDGATENVMMTQVENRWVPADLAKDWAVNIAKAKKAIDGITPEKIAQTKMQAMMTIGGLEAMVAQLSQAQSQAQFDQAIGGLMMGLMSMQRPPPGQQPPAQPSTTTSAPIKATN